MRISAINVSILTDGPPTLRIFDGSRRDAFMQIYTQQ